MVPEARFLGRWFTAARRGGFLAYLTPLQWQVLCALLSFFSRDGRCPFTVDQLAYTLGISKETASERLNDLSQVFWKEEPLLTLEFDASGEVCGAELAPLDLLRRMEAPESPTLPESPTEMESPTLPESPTESDASPKLAEYSELPEPDLPTPGAELSSDLYGALQEAGLYGEQIDRLLTDFPEERIRRQLQWLPARKARIPAAMLVRAIEGDWGAPKEIG